MSYVSMPAVVGGDSGLELQGAQRCAWLGLAADPPELTRGPIGSLAPATPPPPSHSHTHCSGQAFHWSIEVTVLLRAWKTDAWWNYLLTLLAWFLISVGFEGLQKVRRTHARASKRQRRRDRPSSGDDAESSADGLLHVQTSGVAGAGGGATSFHVQLALLYVLQLVLSYLIMLVIMSKWDCRFRGVYWGRLGFAMCEC